MVLMLNLISIVCNYLEFLNYVLGFRDWKIYELCMLDNMLICI